MTCAGKTSARTTIPPPMKHRNTAARMKPPKLSRSSSEEDDSRASAGGRWSSGVRLCIAPPVNAAATVKGRSEEHTSELQSLMRISYAVFCLKQKHNIETTYRHMMT